MLAPRATYAAVAVHEQAVHEQEAPGQEGHEPAPPVDVPPPGGETAEEPAGAPRAEAFREREPDTGIPVSDWINAATLAAREVFGDDWERRLAELLAFLRRRVTGDYAVDEYGFDREVTERFFLAMQAAGTELPQAAPPDIFRRMVDMVSDYAIFAIDTQGKVMNWNRGAEKINFVRHDGRLGSCGQRRNRRALARRCPSRCRRRARQSPL